MPQARRNHSPPARRPRYAAARAFFFTFALILLFALWSYVKSDDSVQVLAHANSLVKRENDAINGANSNEMAITSRADQDVSNRPYLKLYVGANTIPTVPSCSLR